MYYEEKVIDGVLCWRGTPRGEWIAKTERQLTDRLLEAELEVASLRRKLYGDEV